MSGNIFYQSFKHKQYQGPAHFALLITDLTENPIASAWPTASLILTLLWHRSPFPLTLLFYNNSNRKTVHCPQPAIFITMLSVS